MARSLLIFASVLAFASVLVSSACVKDPTKIKNTQEIVIDDFTPVSSDELTSRAISFVGDLEEGSRQAGDFLLESNRTITNNHDSAGTTYLKLKVPGTINYLRIENIKGNPKGAVCSYNDTVGNSTVSYSIRYLPYTEIQLHLFIGVH